MTTIRRDLIATFIVFAVAFAVRLCTLFFVYSNRVFTQYLTLGEQLRHNHLLAVQPFSYSPVYCYFLAFSRTLYDSLFFVLVLQCAIGGVTCALIFIISQKLMGRKTAFVCAAAACLYRSFILYDLSFMSDFFGVALQLFFAASLRVGQKTRYWVIPGIAIGLCILQRPNSLLLIPCMLFWLYVHKESLRDWLTKSSVALICSLLVLLPVILQNLKLTDSLSVAYSSPGYVFYCSNNYDCTGARYSPPPLLIQAELTKPARKDYIFRGDVELSTELASGISGRDMNIKMASEFYRAQSAHYLQSYPREAAALFLHKFWMSFHGYEPHDTLPVIMKQRSLFYLPLGYWLIAPLGLLGVFFSLKNWKCYLPVYFILVNQFTMMLLFYVVVRFRLPVEAALMIMSALALKKLFLIVQNRQWGRAVGFSVAACILFFACNVKDTVIDELAESQANYHFMAAEIAHEDKNYREAIFYLRSALENADAPLAASCHNYLAKIYEEFGESGQSERERQEAENSVSGELKSLEIEFSRGQIPFRRLLRLASLYEQNRQVEAASHILSLANKIKPSNPVVRYHLARLQISSGDAVKARSNLKIALADGLLFTSYGMYACFYLAESYKQSDSAAANKYYVQAARQAHFLEKASKNQHVQKILARLRSLGYLKSK